VIAKPNDEGLGEAESKIGISFEIGKRMGPAFWSVVNRGLVVLLRDFIEIVNRTFPSWP
jgi:hypothetical protein